ETQAAHLRVNVRKFISGLRAAATRGLSVYLVCICPASPRISQQSKWATFLPTLERELADALKDLNSVYVVTAGELLRLYTVADYYDDYGARTANIPYTATFFGALGTM